MSIQIIERDGKPEWAVLPYETYLELVEQAEALQNIRDYDTAIAALERGEEELVPSDVVYAILDVCNPIKVWREHRGLAQHQVADAAGISIPYLSQLETGTRQGSTRVLSAIAKALGLLLDDLVLREEN